MIRLTQGDSPVWVNPTWVRRVSGCREMHPTFDGTGWSPKPCGGSEIHLYSEKWPVRVDEAPEVVVEMIEAAYRGD